MKIVQINVVYKLGSTGKIVYDLHNGLMNRNINSTVIYGRGSEVDDLNVFKTSNEINAKFNNLFSRLSGLQYNGSYFSTKKIIGLLKEIKPDIVHLHCINGFFVDVYKLLNYLSSNSIPTVITLHAEFMFTGSCGHSLECTKWMNNPGCGKCYQLKSATNSMIFDRTRTAWLKMHSSFSQFDRSKIMITSVSPWLRDRANKSEILKNFEHKVVLNGVDADIYRNYSNRKGKFRVLHVTSYFDGSKGNFKGGEFVIELAKMLGDNYEIVVIGRNDNSVELPSNITVLGRIDNQVQLAKEYSKADITLITSKKETYSMVTAESLMCGTPVVGFKSGGPDSIAIPKYSSFVKYGDINELCNQVMKFQDKEIDSRLVSKEAREYYSTERMIDSFLEIYNCLVRGDK